MAVGLVGALLTSPIAETAPNTDFSWTEPTNYEDGTVIPNTDVLTYKLSCSTTSGPTYEFPIGSIGVDTNSATLVDVGSCVQGIPGTYYFVLTATSADFGSESVYSNEISHTFTADDLGKVPNAPVLISISVSA